MHRIGKHLLLPASLVLLAGCASTPATTSTTAQPGAIQGSVHGGQQPVSGSTIQLYASGTTGDGSAATPLLTAPVLTNANGGFTLTGLYTCPSASSLVYLVATGGNPGLGASGNNPQLALMAALGPCGNVTSSTFISVNELTTVAAVSALAPYMTSFTSIGSGSADVSGLSSLFDLAAEFVNTATGTSPGAYVLSGVTVPTAQLNTLANILATCINSAGGVSGDGSACGTLFALATPSGSTPPADTIIAALDIANNPTLNASGLYNLATPSGPFQPTLVSPPVSFGFHPLPVDPFSVTASSLAFGSVQQGLTSPAQTVSLLNSPTVLLPSQTDTTYTTYEFKLTGANAADFTVVNSNVVSSSGGLSSAYSFPYTSSPFLIYFTPSAVGSRSATLTIYVLEANSEPIFTIPLTGQGTAIGTAGPITLTPSPLAFTAFGVPQNATLTNLGSTALNINQISLGSSNAFTQTNNCGSQLAPQSICTISVIATPLTSGNASTTLTVQDDAASGPQSISVTYTSQGYSAPPILSAPSVSVSDGSASTFFITQAANSPLITLALSGRNASDFSLSGGSTGQSTTCPATTQSAAQCILMLGFAASAPGTRTASVTVTRVGPMGVGTITVGVIPVSAIGYPSGPSFDSGIGGSFGVVTVGQSASFQETISNSGTTLLTLRPPVISGPAASDFTVTFTNCTNIPINQYCYATVTATPTQSGVRTATVTVTDSTGTFQQSGPLQVTGAPLALSAPTFSPSTAITFPLTPINAVSAGQAVTISAAYNDPITIAVSAPFQVDKTFCAVTPCTVTVYFAPTVGGFSGGGVNATDTFYSFVGGIAVSGTSGQPAVGLSPTSLNFPLRSVNTTSIAQTVTLTNTGNLPLTLSSISLAGADPSDYVLINNCPANVAVGANCNFTISFAPTVAGMRTAIVQIISNAPSSPDSVSLSGTAQ